MGIVFKNNAKTTLASSLSNSATSATVTDGSVFPSLSAGEFFLITFDDGSNNEICKCTARSGNTLTIVRAQESTTARAFSSGDAAEGRVTAGVLEQIQENIAAKSANQTVFNTTTAGGATTYNIGTNPGVEANAMVFLNGVLQHHDTISFSGTNLTFDAAPPNGMALEVIVDNLINLQSSNLTVDTFTAADVSGNPQTDFTLSDTPAAETNLIVFVDGVFQDQDAYTISSNTLTITTGVIAGRGVTVYVINPVNIGTPSDSTVTSDKLSGNITMPGSLTVGSHDVAFDSPTFFVDHTNSRVGLGTSSPSVPVDIVGEVKTSSHINIGGNLVKAGSSDLTIDVGGRIDLSADDNGEIRLYDGSSRYAQFKDDDDRLSIQGLIQDKDMLFVINDGGSMTTALKLDAADGGDATFYGGVTINGDSSINRGNQTSGELLLGGITDGGFVDFDGTSLQLNTQRDPNTGTFINTGKSNARIELVGADGDAHIKFRTTASNNTSATERVRITSAGDLGVGVSAPTETFVVSGDTNITGQMYLGPEGGNRRPFAKASSWGYSSGYRAVVLGSASATYHTSISGAVTLSFNYDPSGNSNGSFSGNGNEILFRNGTQFVTPNSADDAFNLMNLVLKDGSVGIGTAPSRILDVEVSGGHAIGSVVSGTSNIAGFVFGDTSADDQGGVLYDNSSDFQYFRAGGAERMRITSTHLLVGKTVTNTNTNGLTVSANDFMSYTNDSTDTDDRCFLVNQHGRSSGVLIEFRTQNSNVGTISLNTSGNMVYGGTSDYRLKENINYTWNATDKLKELKPCEFEWKSDKYNGVNQGFIAHEVQSVIPQAVMGDKDALDKDKNPSYQMLDNSKLVPLLVKTIQELEARLTALENE